jgi:hypothetical protein
MAQVALILRAFNFGTDEQTGLSEVAVFDSVIKESHHFEISITENPVETGVSMADHAYAKPDTLQMEVSVSDTPLLLDSSGTPAYQLAQAWTGAGSWNGNGSGITRRSVNAWAYLVEKAKSFAVFDVVTGLKTYINMMIASGDVEQTKDSAGVMRAKLQLRQVQFATTASVIYPPRGDKAKKHQAAPKNDAGKKDAPKVEPTEKPEDSLLVKALNAIFGD